jgi:hypothetical protein
MGKGMIKSRKALLLAGASALVLLVCAAAANAKTFPRAAPAYSSQP